ncbi:hypothetical protein ABH975_004191 [Bradyrhizobium ottawaense]|uniref:hypothetical protein n=1 Tax=Bradyrhizobium ottawaense TaxID=931866 RepID=UPI0035192C5C
MRLSQADRRRGFTEADAAGLAYVRALARQQGITPDALHKYEGQYLATHRSWRGKDREEFIRRAASGIGLEPHVIDATFDDIEHASEHGIPDVKAPAPSPAEDQRRLQEIQDILRSDRRKYDQDNLGDEMIDIRRRLGAEAGMSVQPIPTEAPARNARIDELRDMMRDPASNYWRGPRAEATQAEYRQLVGGGGEPAGAANVPAGVPARTSSQPTGGAPSASASQSALPADNQGN